MGVSAELCQAGEDQDFTFWPQLPQFFFRVWSPSFRLLCGVETNPNTHSFLKGERNGEEKCKRLSDTCVPPPQDFFRHSCVAGVVSMWSWQSCMPTRPDTKCFNLFNWPVYGFHLPLGEGKGKKEKNIKEKNPTTKHKECKFSQLCERLSIPYTHMHMLAKQPFKVVGVVSYKSSI